jgi:hypothetical protein
MRDGPPRFGGVRPPSTDPTLRARQQLLQGEDIGYRCSSKPKLLEVILESRSLLLTPYPTHLDRTIRDLTLAHPTRFRVVPESRVQLVLECRAAMWLDVGHHRLELAFDHSKSANGSFGDLLVDREAKRLPDRKALDAPDRVDDEKQLLGEGSRFWMVDSLAPRQRLTSIVALLEMAPPRAIHDWDRKDRRENCAQGDQKRVVVLRPVDHHDLEHR